jgi:cell division protease FtsH
MIDQEVRQIISGEYKKALEILTDRKDALTKGAQLLLEKEKIEGNEIKALLG